MALVFASASAGATIIDFDPTSYGRGTNLSNVQDGLSISRLSWPGGSPIGNPLPPTRGDVFATRCSDVYFSCLSGDNLGFGRTNLLEEYEPCLNGTRDCFGGPDVLEFTFRDLADSVSIALTWASDAPGLLAYDIDGNVLERCIFSLSCASAFSTGMPDSRGTMLTVSRDQRDIHRIVVGGIQGVSFAHRLSYSIPEPSTFALMAVGLLGLGARRLR